jgi:hypothetical protein
VQNNHPQNRLSDFRSNQILAKKKHKTLVTDKKIITVHRSQTLKVRTRSVFQCFSVQTLNENQKLILGDYFFLMVFMGLNFFLLFLKRDTFFKWCPCIGVRLSCKKSQVLCGFWNILGILGIFEISLEFQEFQ